MSQVKFFKVATLPGSLEADSFYYVQNGTVAESYLTNSTGVARSVGNTAMINSLISTALANWQASSNAVAIVATLAARNTLISTLTASSMILVIDASADATVNSGSALYAYDFATTTTYKIAEYESMDVVLRWADIQNKPTSTVEQLDLAVSQSHTHTNKAVLDKLTEVSGSLRYNNVGLTTDWTTANW